jgi:hypothetical protein
VAEVDRCLRDLDAANAEVFPGLFKKEAVGAADFQEATALGQHLLKALYDFAEFAPQDQGAALVVRITVRVATVKVFCSVIGIRIEIIRHCRSEAAVTTT